MAMKRHRENEGTTLESWGMQNCSISITPDTTSVSSSTTSPEEVFECKTCNRKFNSFQALGGHRASHNKRVEMEGEEQQLKLKNKGKIYGLGKQSEPKIHNCFICGQGFSLGQALGGHMRRHRASTNDVFSSINQVVAKVSVLKRSCNDKVFYLDLNLTPLENDLKLLLFGKLSPKVNLSSF